MEEYIHVHIKQKEAGVAILISERADIKEGQLSKLNKGIK